MLTNMYKLFLACSLSFAVSQPLWAQHAVTDKNTAGAFPVVSNAIATPILVDEHDFALVNKAAAYLQSDILQVTQTKPSLHHHIPTSGKQVIIVGSLDSSTLIQQLVKSKKLSIDSIKGKWEAYTIQVVEAPFKGISSALVIAGSDRRGTAYGVFDLSQQMGVSPWYWWADVPVKSKKDLYITKGFKKWDAPKVKYRGIFLNDEAPALSGWSKEKFGGFNHLFYEKVFELILRLKGNYLWPAMWGNAFYDDDPMNAVVANEWGIVMGTSHHEPLGRAHDEWRRFGSGKWNYDVNEKALKEFWRGGMERMKNYEQIVSIGMRGDGDEPMSQGTAISLLERIVADQRKIIGEVTGKNPSQTPQLWALYKEVQDYYDKGMRVPDDVTLLISDDNWGNIRKLPKKGEKQHAGGYGIYYHFDYVGGPRNYKWINTNQIERTWEQMHLAYEYGADRIWIVNVGDLKPMELPIDFFLDYAWNPNAWPAQKLPDYYTQWATEQFGQQYAKEIGDILAKYTKYNSRRKPELLSPDTYSLTAYNEADRVVTEYNTLLAKATRIGKALPQQYKDAYYQLVLHPVQASANLNELYVTVAKNRKLAKEGNPMANVYADKAKELYRNDSLITNYYNDTLAGGKWSHMMDQTHIGYTYWQQPPVNKMPEVTYVQAANVSAVKQSDKSTLTPTGRRSTVNKFSEKDGYVAMEADHYTKAVSTPQISWQVIPNLGRTGSAVQAIPVTAPSVTPGGNSPHLAYEMYINNPGTAKVQIYLSPTLPFHNDGLRYAISIDDEAPQIVNMNEGETNELKGVWNQWVGNNIIKKRTTHNIDKKGWHTVKFWLVDAGVVLQKIEVDLGGLKESYLGAPETLLH